jgi:Helix-turn-helix
MANTSTISHRKLFYFRQRYKNRVFQSVVAFFANQARENGLTKKDVAERLGKDPAQITRWFSGPGNWTLDTVSDLLLAMDAEMSDSISPFDADRQAATSTVGVGPSQKTLDKRSQVSGTTGHPVRMRKIA